MKYNIVLIGAMGIGKTTIANLICDTDSKYSVLESDLEKRSFVAGSGFIAEDFNKKLNNEGWLASYNYAKSFLKSNHLRMMMDSASTDKIINLAVDMLEWDSEEDVQNCQNVLEEYPNVILLSCSDDLKESCTELASRIKSRPNKNSDSELEEIITFNNKHIESGLLKKFAKHIIETKGKSKTEVANEIIKIYADSFPNIDEV